jgi:hypothetical protein
MQLPCQRFANEQFTPTPLPDTIAFMPKIDEINPLIVDSLSVWPGGTLARRDILLDLAWGDSVTLTNLRAPIHFGARVDAPSHYRMFARSIEDGLLEFRGLITQPLRLAGFAASPMRAF